MRAKIFPLPIHVRSPRENVSYDEQHEGHKIYTGSGHRCGVIPYSSVVWWIASWVEDEHVQGMNSPLRTGVLELDELVWLRMEWIRPKIYCLLMWWLVLFIEALVLFANIEREGRQQWPF